MEENLNFILARFDEIVMIKVYERAVFLIIIWIYMVFVIYICFVGHEYIYNILIYTFELSQSLADS